MSSARHALTDLLVRAGRDPDRELDWRRQSRRLLVPVAAAAMLLAGWSAAAPLAGAVRAPAQVTAQYKRKTVQHQEGGIVRRILVRDGQAVHAGDPLLVVGDVRQDAELDLLQDQWRAARVRSARADAEVRFAAAFEAPAELLRDPAAAEHVARETGVFVARRQALDEQTALLQAQARQVEAQASALESQGAAAAVSGTLSEEELALNEQLASQGFVNRARLIGLQRVASDYRSRVAEVRGDLAGVRQRAAELRARGAQLRLAYRTQAVDESKEAAARVRELDERLRPSRDQVERQVVRAPVDGEVMSLHVATPGTVVAPREPLLELVPRQEKLVVDARIDPQDIEHVHVGGMAEVRLLSAEPRRAQPLHARITFVSADRVVQAETGHSWFDVTVEVDAQALSASPQPLHLQAGMPAELFVTTGDRTLLEYLLKPLRGFAARGLREPG
jgi:HlyD family type I secretion membrane fusion protein